MAGSVLFGGADFCGGVAARRAPALVVTFFSGFTAIAILMIGLPFAGGVTRIPDLLWGVLGGICGGVGAMLLYRALAIGPVSVASPVVSLVGLALPVLVGFAIGERPGAIAVAGLALAPLAILLLARGPKAAAGAMARGEGGGGDVVWGDDRGGEFAQGGDGRRATEGTRRVLIASLGAGSVLGFFLVFLGRIEAGAGLWPLIVARCAGLVVLLAALLVRRHPLVPPAGARGISLVTGLLDSIANVAYVAAVQRGSLALVAALVSLAPATTVLLARGLLAERWGAAQRAGLALALLSGICISMG